MFAPDSLDVVIAGRFERRHARNIAGYLDGVARVLELGAGIGFIGMRTVMISDHVTYMAQDSRAALVDYGRQLADRAGINRDRLSFADGPLVPDGAGKAGGLAAHLADFRPDALRIGRARDVPADALSGQDLSRVRRILIPVVSDEQAALLRDQYGPVLHGMGFVEDPARAGSGSLQFDRT